MKAILDAGVFVAVEKRDRKIGAMLRVLQKRRVPLSTSAAVVAQVWRDGARQAEIARMLPGVDVRTLALDDGKRAGELQASSATADVVDAHVALLAAPGDLLLTSDCGDLARLMAVRAVEIDIVDV